ncbi:DUF2505 domain-containing protein [Rhodococcus sp. 3Y1]
MSRRIEHLSKYTVPAEKVHEAVTSEQYWRDRIVAVGGPGATIEELTVRDETVAVTMSQIIAAEHLPSMVSKVVNGDIVIKRSETMAPFKDGKATGTFSAHVDGVPARVEGTQVLTGDENSATLEIDGEVEVKIPFLGGKIESAIVDEVVRLIQAEQDFTRSGSRSKTLRAAAVVDTADLACHSV